jgi:hypothetical protein
MVGCRVELDVADDQVGSTRSGCMLWSLGINVAGFLQQFDFVSFRVTNAERM